MNALIAAYKPVNVSSNHFLQKIKQKLKKYAIANNLGRIDKIGFSGILDPFACGTIIIATNAYTRLLPHIDLSRKTYKATIFLGLDSKSLDTENIQNLEVLEGFRDEVVLEIFNNFESELKYHPPAFSAKKIDGRKSYELARNGEIAPLKEEIMKIFNLEFLNYSHPFISFKTTVSKGSYIRSLGQIIASRIGVVGSLCFLERLKEGDIFANYDAISFLNPLDFMPYEIILGTTISEILGIDAREIFQNGKKLRLQNLQSGTFVIKFQDFFSIISITDCKDVRYILNKIPLPSLQDSFIQMDKLC